jgi:predicted Zn-dependent protease
MMSRPQQSLQDNPFNEIELSVQEIKWLTEIGFIAPQLGQPKVALTIFHALLLCRPDKDFPYIGLATTYIGMSKHTEAIALLEKTLLQHPDSLEVKTLLAMALKFNQRNNEADRLLTEVLHTQKDSIEPVYALAEALLKPHAIKPQNTRR